MLWLKPCICMHSDARNIDKTEKAIVALSANNEKKGMIGSKRKTIGSTISFLYHRKRLPSH